MEQITIYSLIISKLVPQNRLQMGRDYNQIHIFFFNIINIQFSNFVRWKENETYGMYSLIISFNIVSVRSYINRIESNVY